MIEIAEAEDGFEDWHALRALIAEAFAFMEGRIDPPSSLTRMDAASLKAKAAVETLLLAREDGRLVGCLFVEDKGDRLYLSKLAVAPGMQRRGVGRALVGAAERIAGGTRALTLQTRIELEENHRAFARMGFVWTGETAHPGFDRPTSVTMTKPPAA